MRPAARNILHHRGEQRCVDVATVAGPWLVSRVANCDGDAEINVAGFKFLEFLSKNEIARRPEAENERDLARPTSVGEITHHAHHRRDAHARADQDHAFSPFYP